MDNNQTGDTQSKITLLKGLRQSRQFGSGHVPDDALNDILDVARWTGSGMNQQPWEFVVVRDRDVLRQISEAENKGSWLPGVDLAIVLVMRGESKEIETYDEARLTERILLAAAAHDLSAGIWWFKDGGEAAKRILGIPGERSVRTSVGVGYPSEDASSRPKKPDARKPLSELVHQEKY